MDFWMKPHEQDGDRLSVPCFFTWPQQAHTLSEILSLFETPERLRGFL